MSSFGFDVGNVFGDGGFGSARKGRKSKKGSKKKKDDFDCLNCNDQGFGNLGIDSFSLAEPEIDALGIGGDFGSQIGSRAGKANGHGNFLGVIGREQVSVPSVTGKGRIARGRSAGRGRSAKRKRSPLQKQTGSSFGNVDKNFLGSIDNVVSNVRGAKRRIDKFRAGRKAKSREDPKQLVFEQPALTDRREAEPIAQREPPALEDKSRGSLPRRNGDRTALQSQPRESGSEAIARLRREEGA